QFFDYHHAAAAGDDETVTLGVVGAGRFLRRLVVLAGEGAHGVEQAALAVVLLFTTTGENHVLLTHLDLFHCMADAMCASGAGRCDGIVDALDAERRGQTGRDRAAHGAWHAIRANALDALVAQDIDGFHLVDGRGATGTGNQADTWIGNVIGAEARVFQSRSEERRV